MQVLQHLADVESFCTRLQVLLQHRERPPLEHAAAKRGGSEDGDDDDAVENEQGEAFDAEKGSKPVAAGKLVAAAASTAKCPAPVLAISIPDIRDDDDFYFGDEADAPVELSFLRSQVMKSRGRRAVASAAQVLLQLALCRATFFLKKWRETQTRQRECTTRAMN